MVELARKCLIDGAERQPVEYWQLMSRGRVLLLEDDLALRGLLHEVLGLEDFEVVVCESYEAIRAAAAGAQGDVAVADFWGTAQRTLSASGRVQIVELTQLVPVVLLTGRNWAYGVTAEELGAWALLHKPFDVDELLGVIAAALQSGS
jgi:DNA-binding response OmpR family regulator